MADLGVTVHVADLQEVKDALAAASEHIGKVEGERDELRTLLLIERDKNDGLNEMGAETWRENQALWTVVKAVREHTDRHPFRSNAAIISALADLDALLASRGAPTPEKSE